MNERSIPPQMKYIHPRHYEGVKYDSEVNQIRMRLRVERYCLKCDRFMGKDHDFSECQVIDKWDGGEIVRHKNCPFTIVIPYHQLMEPEKWVKCGVEG